MTEPAWDAVEQEEHERDEKYITAETRRDVLLRDDFRCQRCGDEDSGKLTLHHVVFRSQGGGHQASNLITLCWPCHRKIHDRTLRVTRISGRWFFAEKNVDPIPGVRRRYW